MGMLINIRSNLALKTFSYFKTNFVVCFILHYKKCLRQTEQNRYEIGLEKRNGGGKKGEWVKVNKKRARLSHGR